jgi:hypothetical protein
VKLQLLEWGEGWRLLAGGVQAASCSACTEPGSSSSSGHAVEWRKAAAAGGYEGLETGLP